MKNRRRARLCSYVYRPFPQCYSATQIGLNANESFFRLKTNKKEPPHIKRVRIDLVFLFFFFIFGSFYYSAVLFVLEHSAACYRAWSDIVF